jgi:hypothetical protein
LKKVALSRGLGIIESQDFVLSGKAFNVHQAESLQFHRTVPWTPDRRKFRLLPRPGQHSFIQAEPLQGIALSRGLGIRRK